jgi:hypothetical protein
MLPNYRIYYSDGSTFEGDPSAAPKTGVQVIIVRDGSKGRRVLKLVDYYVWSPTLDRWVDCIDSASVMLRAVREPWVVILCGEYLCEADFEQVLIAAHNDPDFPAQPGNPWRN